LLEGLYGQASTNIKYFKVLVNGVATALQGHTIYKQLEKALILFTSPLTGRSPAAQRLNR
jgi:hypothetical protein